MFRACKLIFASACIVLAAAAPSQTPIYTFQGSGAVRAGAVAQAAGDVNKDGRPDLIVAYPDENGTRGVARVFSGRDGRLLHKLENKNGIAGDLYGVPCGGAGDVNKDGHGDFFVVGGSQYTYPTSSTPHVDVFSGKDGKLLHQLTGVKTELFGYACCAAGDLNKDGHADLAVCVPNASASSRVRVYSGKDGKLMRSAPGGGAHVLRSAGDVDKDSFPDLIVSSPVDGTQSGSAFVLSGRWFVLGTGQQVIHQYAGSVAFDRLGIAIDGVGDVDRDGYGDFVIGASSRVSPRADVYSGKTGKLLYTLAFGSLGTLAGVGDVDLDGYPDIAVGYPYLLTLNPTGLGRVDIHSGKAGALLFSVYATGPTSLVSGDNLGIDVDGLGDVNGDGVPDFVAGASGSMINNTLNTGYARVYSGGALSLSTDIHAFSLAKANTQNLMVDAGAKNGGRLYHVFGSVTGTSPGVTLGSPVGAVTIPLNPDPWTDITLALANSSFLVNTRGTLDTSGRAIAQIKGGPVSSPSLLGIVLYQAALIYDAKNNYYLATNPTTLLLDR